MTADPSLAGVVYAALVAAAPWILVLIRPHCPSGASRPSPVAQCSESAAPPRAVGTVQDDIIDLLATVRHQPLDETLRQSTRALLAELGQRRTSDFPQARRAVHAEGRRTTTGIA